MTALGKLLRTTAFQLTLVYLLIFILFAVSLLGYFALNTRRLITEQITATVNGEITGLSEQYAQGGIRRLVIVVDLRSRRPGSSLYLVTTPTGEALAGNVAALAPGALDHPGWIETSYRRIEAPDDVEHRAMVQVVELPGGFRLLVGRDLEERERIYGIIANAGQWSLALVIVLGLVGGFFVSRRVLSRIDAMTGTAQTIMAGDLSGRLPVAGSGDELDRLANNVNAMLDRIVALGFPTLVGTSRKSTIGKLTGRGVEAREFGTAATVALAVAAGVDVVRVHDVAEQTDVVRVADAIVRGWRPDGWTERLP